MGAETNVSSFLVFFFLVSLTRSRQIFERLTSGNYLRLPGPPLSKYSSVGELLDKGVNVAIGVADEAAARNTRFEIAWVSPDSFFFLLRRCFDD